MPGAKKRANIPQAKFWLCFSLNIHPHAHVLETAMKRLGGSSYTSGRQRGSSISKGESLADTIRVIGGYADAM